jgi:hypothetical protein
VVLGAGERESFPPQAKSTTIEPDEVGRLQSEPGDRAASRTSNDVGDFPGSLPDPLIASPPPFPLLA